jgi:integrase
MKLSITSIRELVLPAGVSEKTFFDDSAPGFGVRVRKSGARVYVAQYKVGTKNRRLVLGATDALDLSKARAMAKDALAAVRLGRDPVGEKHAAEQKASAATRFDALLARFLARQRARLKPRSFAETDRHLTVQAKPLHKLDLHAVTRRVIADRLAEITEQSGPAAANRCRASLSAYFTWVAREGIVDANPVAMTNKAIEVGARERLLTDDELVAIWRACGDDQYSTIVRLLILTGARRDGIANLRRSEVDLGAATITLPPERTKSRRSKPREHIIPASPAVLAILRAEPRRTNPDGTPRDLIFGSGARGFSGWSKAKIEIDARIAKARGMPVDDWTLHDFRRVMSTAMHERLGVLPHIVEAVLGHVGGHLSGVAGVYNVSEYATMKRGALEQWASFVLALAVDKPPADNIVKLMHA